MPKTAFFPHELAIFCQLKTEEKTLFSTLHHLSPVIFATTTLVAFVLLGNSKLNFHCYTQHELTPTQKLAWKQQLRLFATSCAKDYEGHSLIQTSFTELPNSLCVCVRACMCVCVCVWWSWWWWCGCVRLVVVA